MTAAARPFRFTLPPEAVSDLEVRIQRTRWPTTIEGDQWNSGTDVQFMRQFADHWGRSFDWSAMERRLNDLPQYLVDIDGITIHFAHVRGTGSGRRPLLITHGWPGTYLEMAKIAPLLADPEGSGMTEGRSFDIVIPSLPGFGFSAAPTTSGFNTRRIAQLWHKLMTSLGYASYLIQGGDIGAGVCSWLARLYPEAIIGMHLNFIPASYQPDLGKGTSPLTAEEQRWLQARQRWLEDEGAYSHLQGTRPQSLAFAMTDSPVGLAAWIFEKYRAWSDCHGDVLSKFSMDELLTTASIYWLSGNVASTLRIYKENRESLLRLENGERIRAPLAYACFPKEICPPPHEWVARGYTIARWTAMPRGGHFAAMEEPRLLAEDIHASFAAFG